MLPRDDPDPQYILQRGQPEVLLLCRALYSTRTHTKKMNSSSSLFVLLYPPSATEISLEASGWGCRNKREGNLLFWKQ